MKFASKFHPEKATKRSLRGISSHNSILPALSAILLILSFPNFNLWPLAWFGFVPLLFAIEKEKPLKRFLISYLTGVLFFLGVIHWLIHVTLPGMIAVVFYLALYFGLFGLFSNYRLLYLPALWVILEWMRSHLLDGFGWALLAHSQSFNLPIIQIADITGAYGVSFLIFASNVAIYLVARNFRKKNFSITPVLVVTAVIFAALYYGYFRLNNVFIGESIKVSVVQGNIPQSRKWDPGFREEISAKYEALTRLAGAQSPDLVVWPETSVPGFLESEKDLFSRTKSLAIAIKAPMLVGTPAENLLEKDSYYNSAVLIDEDGAIAGRYDKLHLVPFGEYIPFKKALSFVQKFSTMPIGDFASGRERTVFKFIIQKAFEDKGVRWKIMKKVKFSCLICFEDIFPEISREFVKNGASFLVNITNDAWFGKTSAAYQHAQCSVFRAVENRVNVVRAANTGLSCFIDQKGRVTVSVRSGGEDLFVEGFKSQNIVLTNTRTFYNMHGDLFVYFCMAIVLMTVLILAAGRVKDYFGKLL